MILTELHYKAAQMIVNREKTSEVAKECGVSSQTICNWKNDKEFKALLDKYSTEKEKQTLKDLKNDLGNLKDKAIKRLTQILDDDSENSKIHLEAAKLIIDKIDKFDKNENTNVPVASVNENKQTFKKLLEENKKAFSILIPKKSSKDLEKAADELDEGDSIDE